MHRHPMSDALAPKTIMHRKRSLDTCMELKKTTSRNHRDIENNLPWTSQKCLHRHVNHRCTWDRLPRCTPTNLPDPLKQLLHATRSAEQVRATCFGHPNLLLEPLPHSKWSAITASAVLEPGTTCAKVKGDTWESLEDSLVQSGGQALLARLSVSFVDFLDSALQVPRGFTTL